MTLHLGRIIGAALWATTISTAPAGAMVQSDLARSRLENFDATSGLPSAEIRTLAEAENGDLWIATTGGIARWSSGKVAQQAHPGGYERAKVVVTMATDAVGTLWMAPSLGQLICLRGGRFEECLRPDDRIGNDWPIVDLARDARGNMWFATREVVYMFARGQLSWTSSFPRAEAGAIRRLQPADEEVWIGAERGLFVRRANGDITSYSTKGLGTLAPVLDLAAARDGSVLVSGTGVLVRIGKDGTQVVRESDGLPRSDFTSVVGDRDGNIWAASRIGLVRWAPKDSKAALRHYTKAKYPLLEDDLTALLEDRSGGLWIGSRRSGLQRFADPPETLFGRFWPYGLAILGLGFLVFFLLPRRRSSLS